MSAALPCCDACGPASLSVFPTFKVRGLPAWLDAAALGLVFSGVLLGGYLILTDVASALAALSAP